VNEQEAVRRDPVVAAPDLPLHELDVLMPMEFLVAGGCRECRWRCAMPEGARWPKCPGCDEQTHPWRTQDAEEASEGETPKERHARLRARAVGYLAFRCNEMDAVGFVSRQIRLRSPEEILAAGGLGPENIELARREQPGRFGYRA
jgi:hypothetical protein